MESWRLDGAVDGCVAVEVIPDLQQEDPLLRAERLGGGCGSAGRGFAGCLAEYLSPLTLHFDVEASDEQLTQQLVSLALSS